MLLFKHAVILSNIYAIRRFLPPAALRCLIAVVLLAPIRIFRNFGLLLFIGRGENYLTIFVKKMSPVSIGRPSNKYMIDRFRKAQRGDLGLLFCRVVQPGPGERECQGGCHLIDNRVCGCSFFETAVFRVAAFTTVNRVCNLCIESRYPPVDSPPGCYKNLVKFQIVKFLSGDGLILRSVWHVHCVGKGQAQDRIDDLIDMGLVTNTLKPGR
jgi:hypothetical protein